MDDQRFGDDVFYSEARVERGEGILKDDLQVAAQAAYFGAARRKQIGVLETDAARGGLDQAEDEASQSAFAGAGFADETERLAGVDVERDIIDRADLAEDFGQVAKIREGARVDANRRRPRIYTDSHG